jgi:hypothetical protein
VLGHARLLQTHGNYSFRCRWTTVVEDAVRADCVVFPPPVLDDELALLERKEPDLQLWLDLINDGLANATHR